VHRVSSAVRVRFSPIVIIDSRVPVVLLVDPVYTQICTQRWSRSRKYLKCKLNFPMYGRSCPDHFPPHHHI